MLIADDFRDKKLIRTSKEKKFDNRKKFDVLSEVEDTMQSVMSTSWVLTSKNFDEVRSSKRVLRQEDLRNYIFKNRCTNRR